MPNFFLKCEKSVRKPFPFILFFTLTLVSCPGVCFWPCFGDRVRLKYLLPDAQLFPEMRKFSPKTSFLYFFLNPYPCFVSWGVFLTLFWWYSVFKIPFTRCPTFSKNAKIQTQNLFFRFFFIPTRYLVSLGVRLWCTPLAVSLASTLWPPRSFKMPFTRCPTFYWIAIIQTQNLFSPFPSFSIFPLCLQGVRKVVVVENQSLYVWFDVVAFLNNIC